MELVSNLGGFTRRGAEKLAGLWRTSLPGKALLAGSALLVALLVFGVLNAVAAPATTPALTSEQVAGVFADVNGDGLTDFIVNAEVIVNKGPLAP
jgi:hypothetical protein